MATTMKEKRECVQFGCAGNAKGTCVEVADEYPCHVRALLPARGQKRMPSTLEEFRMAANWLARQAAKAGNALSACLAGPAADDEANGICIGYADGRDR